MTNNKTGMLTAIMHNLETMPRIINQFEDAKPGKKAAELVFHKDKPESREEAMIAIVQGTVDNNRIGTLSDYVPMILAKVHAEGEIKIKGLTVDEVVELTKEIRKADAQVNLSIDWAKKFPDVTVTWLATARNTLESEAHKHAGKAKGKAADGKQKFYPELPTFEGNRDGGILSAIHDELKDIPETKGIKSVGITEHGHNIWEEENTKKYDTSKMNIALWKIDGNYRDQFMDKEQMIARMQLIQKKATEKLARKIGREIDRMQKDLFGTISADTAIWRFEDIARLAIEEKYAAEQAYWIMGLGFAGTEQGAENGWKMMSNIRLNWLKDRINNVRQKDDTSLAETVRPIQQVIRLWAKSWAKAKAENLKVEDKKTEEAAEELAKKTQIPDDAYIPDDDL